MSGDDAHENGCGEDIKTDRLDTFSTISEYIQKDVGGMCEILTGQPVWYQKMVLSELVRHFSESLSTDIDLQEMVSK